MPQSHSKQSQYHSFFLSPDAEFWQGPISLGLAGEGSGVWGAAESPWTLYPGGLTAEEAGGSLSWVQCCPCHALSGRNLLALSHLVSHNKVLHLPALLCLHSPATSNCNRAERFSLGALDILYSAEG